MFHHKARGQDAVMLRDEEGKRRTVYLGPHGSLEARQRYREVLALYFAGKPVPTVKSKEERELERLGVSSFPTVEQLVWQFLTWARSEYRNGQGEVSREVVNLTVAARPLLFVLRDRHTDTLTCDDLEEVRRVWVETEFGRQVDEETGKPIDGTGKKRKRSYVNKTLASIMRILRWGAGRQLLPGAVWSHLQAFTHLAPGRGGAVEPTPVEAVPRALVDATLPFLPPTLQAVVEVLWLTGMRPGEALQLRGRDIDRSVAEAWIFRPQQHKTAHKGKLRLVGIGKECQAILLPFLKEDDPEARLFTGEQVMIERKAMWKAARKSKETPSQIARRAENAKKPSRQNANELGVAELRRAITRACEAAGVAHWNPYQLRHASGTRLTIEAGEEAASVQLGHADMRTTRRYNVAAQEARVRKVAQDHA